MILSIYANHFHIRYLCNVQYVNLADNRSIIAGRDEDIWKTNTNFAIRRSLTSNIFSTYSQIYHKMKTHGRAIFTANWAWKEEATCLFLLVLFIFWLNNFRWRFAWTIKVVTWHFCDAVLIAHVCSLNTVCRKNC